MHLIIILAITLIIFGPGKLPELGNGLGKSIRGFKKARSGEDDKLNRTALYCLHLSSLAKKRVFLCELNDLLTSGDVLLN